MKQCSSLLLFFKCRDTTFLYKQKKLKISTFRKVGKGAEWMITGLDKNKVGGM